MGSSQSSSCPATPAGSITIKLLVDPEIGAGTPVASLPMLNAKTLRSICLQIDVSQLDWTSTMWADRKAVISNIIGLYAQEAWGVDTPLSSDRLSNPTIVWQRPDWGPSAQCWVTSIHSTFRLPMDVVTKVSAKTDVEFTLDQILGDDSNEGDEEYSVKVTVNLPQSDGIFIPRKLHESMKKAGVVIGGGSDMDSDEKKSEPHLPSFGAFQKALTASPETAKRVQRSLSSPQLQSSLASIAKSDVGAIKSLAARALATSGDAGALMSGIR